MYLAQIDIVRPQLAQARFCRPQHVIAPKVVSRHLGGNEHAAANALDGLAHHVRGPVDLCGVDKTRPSFNPTRGEEVPLVMLAAPVSGPALVSSASCSYLLFPPHTEHYRSSFHKRYLQDASRFSRREGVPGQVPWTRVLCRVELLTYSGRCPGPPWHLPLASPQYSPPPVGREIPGNTGYWS